MNLFKKLLIMSAAVMMIGTVATAEVIEFTIEDTNYTMEKNGEIANKVLDSAPFISEGRTMVPVYAISEALGAETDWNGEKREVKITGDGVEVLLTIDSPVVISNGEEKKLDAAPVIVSGRTFVPLRFVSEELSYNVNYVNTTRQVVIDNTDIVIKCGEEKISLAQFEALYKIMYNANYYNIEEGNVAEEEFSFYLTQAAVQALSNYARIYSTFPTVSLSAEDKGAIKAALETEQELIKDSTPGMAALIYEKQQFSNGLAIVNKLLAGEDFEKKYNDEYVSAKHILVKDEKLAKDIIKKLDKGTDFDELVKEYNEDPGMEQNPDGYVFTKGEMVKEFEDASYSLKVGEISEPVKTTYGYHIIMKMPLPEINDNIKNDMAVKVANDMIEKAQQPEILIDENELTALIK